MTNYKCHNCEDGLVVLITKTGPLVWVMPIETLQTHEDLHLLCTGCHSMDKNTGWRIEERNVPTSLKGILTTERTIRPVLVVPESEEEEGTDTTSYWSRLSFQEGKITLRCVPAEDNPRKIRKGDAYATCPHTTVQNAHSPTANTFLLDETDEYLDDWLVLCPECTKQVLHDIAERFTELPSEEKE